MLERYKELLDLFNADFDRMDEATRSRHNERIEAQIHELLLGMGKRLGYKVAHLDIKKGGYLPNALFWREQRGPT